MVFSWQISCVKGLQKDKVDPSIFLELLELGGLIKTVVLALSASRLTGKRAAHNLRRDDVLPMFELRELVAPFGNLHAQEMQL